MIARFIFVCVLLLAAGTACHKKQEELPALGQIADFRLKDQTGRALSVADFRGKTWVAAFMFTRCPTICPRITRRMQDVQAHAKKAQVPLTLVSFSVDPEYDTPAVLSEYAREFKLDTSNWRLLTGDIEVIKKTSIESFKMALDGQPDGAADHLGLVHGSHLVLVDGKAQIRGFYRSSDADVVTRLVSDAKRLSSE
ncbi:MAG TPA: SCO family protein [Polyangiaceae bacterium]|nr:SCO family protein [Polyangiaceae bacterium]